MNIRQLSTAAMMAALFSIAGLSNHARAHDTDIYLSPAGGAGAEPLVIFNLDYRPNLGSSLCADISGCNQAIQDLAADGYLKETTNVEPFHVMRAVLKKVLDPLKGVKAAFMMSHDNVSTSKCGTKCSNGAYILKGFDSVDAGGDSQDLHGNPPDPNHSAEDGNKKKIYTILDAMPTPQGGVSHKFQGKEVYFELYRYLTGGSIHNGHNGWYDFATDDTSNVKDPTDLAPDPVDPLRGILSWDETIETPPHTGYVSPLTEAVAGHCSGIYVINILFGVENQDSDSDDAIAADTGIPVGDLKSQDGLRKFIEWLYDADLSPTLEGKQNVTQFFIGNHSKLVDLADAGGTGTPYPFDTNDPEALVKAFERMFGQILSVSTTFVAPSVAVNVYNRAQVESDVFIAMFRAEEEPLWPGNVKKYELGELTFTDPITLEETKVTALLDASTPQKDAVDHIVGRIAKESLSFWTVAGDLPAPGGVGDEFPLAGYDGRFVERGGCGSRIPGFKLTGGAVPGPHNPGYVNVAGNTGETGPRKLFTQPASFTNGTATALRALDVDVNVPTEAADDPDILDALGVALTFGAGDCAVPYVPGAFAQDYSACGLLRFARGLDDQGDNRSWMFADALHSRPLAVNYGDIDGAGGYDENNPDIRIFVGSNDGFLHMIRNTTSGGLEDGVEGWAFMPLETMWTLYHLKVNSPTTTHKYGVDGAPVMLEIGSQKILYFGLRRGGNSYYALDVTDPDDPKMLWQITGGSGDFVELGQTWSTPRFGEMYYKGIDGGTNAPYPQEPVVIFAGGYDENKDTHDNGTGHAAQPGGDDGVGNAVFIVNALDGSLVWKVSGHASCAPGPKVVCEPKMKDSIPSDVTAVDTDNNTRTDRIYVGDTGGRLWRIDTRGPEPIFTAEDPARNNWKITEVMSVGRHHLAGTPHDANDRRFFNAPDYVQTFDDGNIPYDAVVLGTGDRADPLNIATENYFYVFRDYFIEIGFPPTSVVTHTGLAPGDVTADCLQEGCAFIPDFSLGWRMKLECPWQDPADDCGEKNLASAFTMEDEIFFTAYQPTKYVLPDYCDPLDPDHDPLVHPTSKECSSCQPSEGIGILYIVSLATGEATRDLYVPSAGLHKDDRYEILNSGGIPSEVVSLGGGEMLRPDLEVEEAGDNTNYSTYWFEREY